MAMMLGRYATSDCSGARRNPRRRKRVEKRAFERELRPPGFLWHPDELAFDLYDCDHGCNGDCEERGSDVCTFVCHELLYVLGLR